MGQVLHGSATTTEAVRRAIQHSQESLRALAKRAVRLRQRRRQHRRDREPIVFRRGMHVEMLHRIDFRPGAVISLARRRLPGDLDRQQQTSGRRGFGRRCDTVVRRELLHFGPT